VITAASAARVRIPFRHAFTSVAGTWRERDAWLISLRDDAGRTGAGEASLDPAAGATLLDRLAISVASTVPGLTGQGALDPWLGQIAVRERPAPAADPVDLALRAGIVGAALDLGLVRLPATRTSVRVNATVGSGNLDSMIGVARAAVEAGFSCLKLKGGDEASTAELVGRLSAVRAVVGPDVELRLDVNGAWDTATAHQRLAAVGADPTIHLAYVEQPIPPDDIAAFADLRAGSSVPIALDESVVSRQATRKLLDAAAADVLVIKPSRVGGPLAAVAIAVEASAAGVPVTISTLLETGVGLTAALRVAAAIPGADHHAHGLATADLLTDDLLAMPLVVTGGRIAAPGDPGAPIGLDATAVDRWAVARVGASS
jgi:o-succinylbenzoate synthase